MHQDTATVMPRSSGALPFSPLQANVAEFRPRTLTADELQSFAQAPNSRLLAAGSERPYRQLFRT
jgi:hypothetical protein